MITLSETVNIWSERKVIARLETPGTQINRFALSPNKKMLAVAYGYIGPCGNRKCESESCDDEDECGVTIWSTTDVIVRRKSRLHNGHLLQRELNKTTNSFRRWPN